MRRGAYVCQSWVIEVIVLFFSEKNSAVSLEVFKVALGVDDFLAKLFGEGFDDLFFRCGDLVAKKFEDDIAAACVVSEVVDVAAARGRLRRYARGNTGMLGAMPGVRAFQVGSWTRSCLIGVDFGCGGRIALDALSQSSGKILVNAHESPVDLVR